MQIRRRHNPHAQPSRSAWRRLLPAAGIAVALLAAPAAVSAGNLFGWSETVNRNLAPFTKWNGMLERYFEEAQKDFDRKSKARGGCGAFSFNRCHHKRWQELVAKLEGKDLRSQLKAVNRHMNDVRYIVDPRNWGVPDYWATPAQFLERDGDCEDYAIAKYLTLKRLGVPVDRMRIVVVQDNNLRVAHAVLAVYDGDEILILDNQISRVVSHTRIRHYQPIFSINENAWWMHLETAAGGGRRHG